MNKVLKPYIEFSKLSEDLCVILSDGAQIVYANQVFLELFQIDLKKGIYFWELSLQPHQLQKDLDLSGKQVEIGFKGAQFTFDSRWRFSSIENGKYILGCGSFTNLSNKALAERLKGNILSEAAEEEANQRLFEAIDKFQLISENVSDVVCLHNPADARYLYVSPSITPMLGFVPEDLLGKNPYNFFHPDFQQFLAQDHERSATGKQDGPPPKADVMLMAKNGKAVWAEVHSTPIFGDNGEVVLILSSTRDITRRKTMEQNLAIKNQELEAFSYRVSHDMRAPLASIMGLSNLLKDETDLKTIQIYNSLIEKSVVKLDEFISSVLKYAQNSHLEIEHQPVNLEAIIHRLISVFEYYPDFKKIRIETAFNHEEGLFSDPTRIGIILNCLLENAVRFQLEGANPYIRISTFSTHDSVSIIMEDNGIGIPESLQNRVFDMFFRGHESSKGAGLGLYITKQAVEKLKGKINLESSVGKGSKFEIILPNHPSN